MAGGRKLNRDAVLYCRVPSKVRYGAELLARKHSASLAVIVEKALNAMFDAEGLTAREAGKFSSMLDELWAGSEVDRLLKLKQFAPGLLTDEERKWLDYMADMESDMGRFFKREELDQALADAKQNASAKVEEYRGIRQLPEG